MNFKTIHIKDWGRKEYFNHDDGEVPCSYSYDNKTGYHPNPAKNLKLYPTALYYLAKTVNEFEPLRTAMRADGNLAIYEKTTPCHTVFHKEKESFSNIGTKYADDYLEFCQRYDRDIQSFGSIEKWQQTPDQPENSFTVSMTPWSAFDGFHLNLQDSGYLIPIFTPGKFQQMQGQCLIPLAIQAHHAVCDGFHVCCFINRLQEMIDFVEI